MTDLTNQDRRDMLEWARIAIASKDNHEHAPWATAASYILATVDAPAPTLAEELRSWAEDASYDEDRDNLLHAADRAEQMEHGIAEARAEVEKERDFGVALAHERDDARAKVERLKRDLAEAYKTRDARDDEVDSLRAEVERLTSERTSKESLQVDQPNPADVKPGEPWLIRVRGRDAVAIRDGHEEWPWSVAFIHGESDEAKDDVVTLVSRLVPAPRVITNPDELDRLAECAIVRDKDGDAWRRTCDEWTTTADYVRFTSWAVSRSGPVTVLWEPEA